MNGREFRDAFGERRDLARGIAQLMERGELAGEAGLVGGGEFHSSRIADLSRAFLHLPIQRANGIGPLLALPHAAKVDALFDERLHPAFGPRFGKCVDFDLDFPPGDRPRRDVEKIRFAQFAHRHARAEVAGGAFEDGRLRQLLRDRADSLGTAGVIQPHERAGMENWTAQKIDCDAGDQRRAHERQTQREMTAEELRHLGQRDDRLTSWECGTRHLNPWAVRCQSERTPAAP